MTDPDTNYINVESDVQNEEFKLSHNSFSKFALFLWKNGILYFRHSRQTIIQVVLPVVICSMLLWIRTLGSRTFIPLGHFQPKEIDTLEALR